MRIVHVSPFYYPSIGGIETFCRELSVRTAQRGHEVHVITFVGADLSDENDAGVEVHRLKPLVSFFKARFSPEVSRLIGEIDPDVVHIQALAPITQEFCIVKGHKYLATYHNDPVLTDRPDYRLSIWVYKWLLFPRFCRRVDRIVSPSKSYQASSKFLELVPDDKKRVIPNGVDSSQFTLPPNSKVKYREKLGIPAEHVGIFVGSMERWHAYKGVNVLLDAISRLRDIDLEFLFVGDGELRPRYEDMARRLRCQGRVKFLGKVGMERLIESYWAADFLVLPSTSRMECFGIVLIEAMACGLPVIATDIPGPSDVFAEGINGFKVEAREPEELSRAIRKLVLLDGDELEQMSSNSRKLAVERYDWTKVVQAYLGEYDRLIHGRLTS